MSNAPVCSINPPLPTAEPQTPTLPAIPVATDLASAIQAINVLRQIVQTLTNQNTNPGPGPRFTSLSSKNQSKKNANFTEIKEKRQTEQTVVKDQNSNASVTVKQITGLTFIDKITGQTITWAQ